MKTNGKIQLYPMVRMTVLLILGMVMAYYTSSHIPCWLWLGGALILLLMTPLVRQELRQSVVVMLLVFLLGGCLMSRSLLLASSPADTMEASPSMMQRAQANALELRNQLVNTLSDKGLEQQELAVVSAFKVWCIACVGIKRTPFGHYLFCVLLHDCTLAPSLSPLVAPRIRRSDSDHDVVVCGLGRYVALGCACCHHDDGLFLVVITKQEPVITERFGLHSHHHACSRSYDSFQHQLPVVVRCCGIYPSLPRSYIFLDPLLVASHHQVVLAFPVCIPCSPVGRSTAYRLLFPSGTQLFPLVESCCDGVYPLDYLSLAPFLPLDVAACSTVVTCSTAVVTCTYPEHLSAGCFLPTWFHHCYTFAASFAGMSDLHHHLCRRCNDLPLSFVQTKYN